MYKWFDSGWNYGVLFFNAINLVNIEELGCVMSNLEIQIEEAKQILNPGFIKDLNCFVTEERLRRPDEGSQGGNEELKKTMPDIELAKEDDFYQVIEDGSLEGLTTNIEYKFDDTVDLIELVSYAIEYIASRQIFGNGNKRTSFLKGYFLIFWYQLQRWAEKENLEDTELEIKVPSLTDEFVELISNVANDDKEESSEDIENFLSDFRTQLSEESGF